MIRHPRIFALLIITVCCAGCATSNLSSMQRRSIEARDLAGNFDDAFRATLAVLQDKGFIIDHTDYQAGVIKGSTGKTQGFAGSISFAVSATLEQFGENNVKERIIVLRERKTDMGQYGSSENSERIDEPQFLQEVYDQIQKEIFVRQNLAK